MELGVKEPDCREADNQLRGLARLSFIQQCGDTRRVCGLMFCTTEVTPYFHFPQAFQRDAGVLCFKFSIMCPLLVIGLSITR